MPRKRSPQSLSPPRKTRPRPGQPNPEPVPAAMKRNRVPDEIRDQLVEYCIEMVCAGVPIVEQIRRLNLRRSELLGVPTTMCRAQADRYLKAARVRMRELLAVDFHDMVAESYQTYVRIKNDPRSKPKDILAAQAAIDRLLGLSAPTRVNHSIQEPVTITFIHAGNVAGCGSPGTAAQEHYAEAQRS